MIYPSGAPCFSSHSIFYMAERVGFTPPGHLASHPTLFLYGGESGIYPSGAPCFSSHFIFIWRREWDSNPRYDFSHTRFPSVRLRPLGHLSTRRHNAHSSVSSIKDCKPLHRSHYVSSFDKMDAHFAKPQLRPLFCRAMKNTAPCVCSSSQNRMLHSIFYWAQE